MNCPTLAERRDTTAGSYDLNPSSRIPQCRPVGVRDRPPPLDLRTPSLFRLDGNKVQGRPKPPLQNVRDPRYKMGGPVPLSAPFRSGRNPHRGFTFDDGGGGVDWRKRSLRERSSVGRARFRRALSPPPNNMKPTEYQEERRV